MTIGEGQGRPLRTLAGDGRSFTLAADDLENGVYGITVEDGNRSYFGRVVVKR